MNMRTRSRMVWTATWQTLSRHFTTVGCHEDLTVGMYAIDSLRQLSMKFLEREELRDFNFQRLFLAPFEVIMANATSLETRELVLRCVENLVLARVGNIRSGWKTIWGVLRIAAETYAPGSEDRVVLLGFQVARAGVVTAAKQAALVDFKTIKELEEDPIDETSTADGVPSPASVHYQKEESICSLEEAEKQVSTPASIAVPTRQRAGFLETQEEKYLESGEAAYNDSVAHMRMWWPVISALSALAADRRVDVRLAALEALFNALETHGKKFSSGLWGLIFKDALIPLLVKLHHLEVVVEKGAFISPKLPLPPTLKPSGHLSHYTAGKTAATLCLERLLECFGLFLTLWGSYRTFSCYWASVWMLVLPTTSLQ
ncbi:unnamed protein product [Peronospora destructor]|uniref:Mon2/Sec7/BIG1-like HDS domain-containing protein n=1 Tax=Peronospora destructor TaxID=86335 RepID=A0AAV0UAD7_9STRA|nr:unnamed protein product [Peronospora destructor]